MQTYVESAARTLALDVARRKSIEVDETAEVNVNVGAIPPGALPANPTARPKVNATNEVRTRYIEDDVGHRFLEIETRTGGKLTAHSVHAFDGTATTNISYRPDDLEKQQVATLERHFYNEGGNNNREMTPSLKYLYVGRKPLYEALPEAKDLGTTEFLSRPCHKLLFPRVARTATLDEVYYLDDATAIPLKVESYRDQEALEKNRPYVSWTAEKLEIIDGHATTPISATQSYNADGGVMVTWKHRVQLIRFDAVIPATTFKPALQPGLTIFNSLTKQTSQAPGAVSKDARVPTVAVASTAPPITADPPADYTAAWSAASMIIGGTLLAAAVFTVWRRRVGGRESH